MKSKVITLFISLFCTGFLMTACNQQPKTETASTERVADGATDSVGYAIKTVVKESRMCNPAGKTDTTCQIVKITYPNFSNSEKLLSDSLTKWLSGGMNPDKTYPTPEASANGFLTDYETFLKGQKELPAAMPWQLLVTISVLHQRKGIIPLLVDYYSYTGGAHGSPATLYHNWDTQLHKELTLEDVLNPGYANSLRMIGERIFRKQENLAPDARLTQGYFFENNRFSLNKNFLITPQGLRFLYNPYEIKPYAAGKTELLLPYDAITSLIKKAGPLDRYRTGGNGK